MRHSITLNNKRLPESINPSRPSEALITLNSTPFISSGVLEEKKARERGQRRRTVFYLQLPRPQ